MAGRATAGCTRCCSTPKSRTPSAALDILRNFAFDVCGCTRRLDDGVVRRGERSSAIRATGRRRARRLRLSRRRRLDGRGAAHPQGDRRSADVHLRRQRPAAPGRSRAGPHAVRAAEPAARCSSTRPTLFLDRLAGVTDPEQKRKIIGATFIDVFEQRAHELGGFDFLAQGTLYPDVIESVSVIGPVGRHQEPSQRRRPARADAVQAGRAAARAVQGRSARGRAGRWASTTSSSGASRFPGPGLAVRMLGAITRDAPRPAAPRRRDRRRRDQDGRLVPAALAVVRRAAAGAERRRDGRRRAPTSTRSRSARSRAATA